MIFLLYKKKSRGFKLTYKLTKFSETLETYSMLLMLYHYDCSVGKIYLYCFFNTGDCMYKLVSFKYISFY